MAPYPNMQCLFVYVKFFLLPSSPYGPLITTLIPKADLSNSNVYRARQVMEMKEAPLD